jgi:glycosyltransferase involved in cell wall biosynthesis
VLLRYFSGIACVATAHNRHVQLHWMLNDHVIGVSEATTRFHRRYNLVRRRRIETIHNFIDHQRFDEVPPAGRSHVRTELGIDDRHVLIGTVGDVIPRKGLLYLVRAMSDVLVRVPHARLAVVGDFKGTVDYMVKCRAEADRLGVTDAVIWAGHRHDVPELLAAFDVYALASLEESLPISVLEAMAAGLPVAATAVGGLPECIVPGVTGELVRPADPQALADALILLARDAALRHRYGAAGRQRVHEQYSPQSQTPRIEAALSLAVLERRAAA